MRYERRGERERERGLRHWALYSNERQENERRWAMRLDATQFNYRCAATGDASELILLGSGSQTKKRTAALTQLLYATLPQLSSATALIYKHTGRR